MKTINELDLVVLDRDVPEHGLCRGDIGTVVHVYRDGRGVEVEFVTGSGDTVAVLSLPTDDVRPIRQQEILHVRDFAE